MQKTQMKWMTALLACWLLLAGVGAQAQFVPSTYGTVLEDMNPAAQGTHSTGDTLTALVASTGPSWTAAGAAGATYNASGTPTGKPTLHTVGNTGDCRFAANSAISASAGSYTIVWVGSLGNNTGSSWIFDTQTGRTVLIGYDTNTSGKTGFYTGSFVGLSTPIGGMHRYCLTMDAGASTSTLYIDNVSAGTGPYNTALAISGTTVLFGAEDSANVSNFIGDTARFTIFSGVLSSANRASMDAALVSTYITASATSYTFAGPTTGSTGVASTVFTLTPNAALGGADTVNLSDGGAGGTFSPTSLSFANGATAGQTFTYMPATAGAKTLTPTSATLALSFSPATRTYTASGGLSAGTITANAVTSSSITPQVTISGGTAPYSVQFSYSTTSGGTYTNVGSPVSTSGTAIGSAQSGLTASTTYYFKATATDSAGTPATVSSPSSGGTALSTSASTIYTRVDATDPIAGQTIMVLVPNSNATTPYNSANPTRLILYFHGAGEDQQALLTDANKLPCTTALLNAGYILAASTGGSTNNWGNQTSIEGYTGLWKYVTSNYNISKTAFWGQSMGGLSSLLSLSEGKIKDVVGWLGTYPVCSLANLYAIGTYAPNINTAYGITGSGTATYANLTTGHDPTLKWGWAFRRIPMQIYASYGDTVVPRTNNTDALATLIGASAAVTVITCTGDHGDPSHFQPANYLTFFNACFASPPQTSGSTGGTKRRVQ